jgi:hypothetical protein
MSDVGWFLVGLMVLPVGFGCWWGLDEIATQFRYWYTRPVDLAGKQLAYRRSLITGLTLELLDATHVRAIRLPFNRIFLIRSNPGARWGRVCREYDFVSQDYVVVGNDFENARSAIGRALDELGHTEETDRDR